MFSKRIKFSVLQIKSTYLVSILYSLLFDRVSGRFEGFSGQNVTSFIVAHHQPGGGGGDSHLKGTGMLVVSLRGVNFRFWSRLGFSGQNVIIFNRQGLV